MFAAASAWRMLWYSCTSYGGRLADLSNGYGALAAPSLHSSSQIRAFPHTPTDHAGPKFPPPSVTPPSPRVSNAHPPEATSDREESGRMAHIVYMSLDHRKMSLSQVACDPLEDCDTVLLRDDWGGSLLPALYICVTLCHTHSDMYHALRGSSMCYRKGCCESGSTGPDGHTYFPAHITAVGAPAPPTSKVSFVT